MARFSSAIVAFVVNIALVVGATKATETQECSEDSSSDTCIANQKGNDSKTNLLNRHSQCALYLAPSTLPKANLGLFSGVDIPAEELANDYFGGTFPGYNDSKDPPLWEDLYVPVVDHYKALPYRGQQLFPSWLAYIWPREPEAFFTEEVPYPYVRRELWEFDEGFNAADELGFYSEVWDDDEDDDDEDDEEWDHLKVSAFVPGIVSLSNSHPQFDNLEMTYANMKKDARAGAFTPHHGVTFETKKSISPGMELLLNYGEDWHEINDEKMAGIKYSGSSKLSREKKGFVEGIAKKWDVMVEEAIDVLPWEMPTEKAKRDNFATKIAHETADIPKGERVYTEYRKNSHHPGEREKEDEDDEDEEEDHSSPILPQDIVKPISWLGQNGVCLSSGRLRIQKSQIPGAGRGVFATTNINAGEVILVSPLIAMRRDDFRIYKTDPSQENAMDEIDKSTVVGEELLLNYAFGHPDSPMLLVPTAPMTNFINHASPRESQNLQPNVRIRWPDSKSNAAKLFDWVFHNHGHLYTKFNENDSTLEHNAWLKMHPIDVMERSGKLGIEYAAIRDIKRNEEILIDYGPLWDEAWSQYNKQHSNTFRHFIQVPSNFYPSNWLHVSDVYEVAETQDLKNKPLEVGKVVPLTWAHNGKPLSSKYGYVIGLPRGFSDKLLANAEKEGIIQLYRKLLTEQDGYVLSSGRFDVYKPYDLGTNATKDLEYYGHRYHSTTWKFNIHFVGAWNELARKSIYAALGDAGFDHALQGLAERFGYDNVTCHIAHYIGLSHCASGKMHTDMYAIEDKSWSLLFPVINVEGTKPELDIMAEDMNTIVAVHYLKDVAYALGDFGYHKTRPNSYYNADNNEDNSDIESVPFRVSAIAYCGEIDETNVAMMRFVHHFNEPSPFMDQFEEHKREVHWSRSGTASLSNPGKD